MITINYKILKMLTLSIFMGCGVLNAQALIYVNANATGANNGRSWSDAYTDLQSALSDASSGVEIRVAAGTYKPTKTPDGSTEDRHKAFYFNKKILLKGSYNPVTNAQDFTNPSILSGDFNGDDAITGSGSTLSITKNSENAYHVLITANLSATTRIEGFLITGGFANGAGSISYSGKSFFHNSAGGMYNHDSSPSIVNTVFSGNVAAAGGGGMSNDNSSPNIVNTVFSKNSSDTGGGIYNLFKSSPSIVNTVFSGNFAADTGGGIFNRFSSPNIVNTVFIGNAADTGGGLYEIDSSTSTIYNSVFYGNGSDIVNSANSSATGGNNFSEHYKGTGFTALDKDPFYRSRNPIGRDGVWFTTDDGLHPGSATSPITDKGDADKLPLDTADLNGDDITEETIPFDITGRSRIAGTTVDVGAYEYESTVLSVNDIDSSKLDIYSTGYKTLVIQGVFNAKTTTNVYNLLGKLVASKTFDKFSTSNSLDVSSLSTGIYIVKMHNANQQVHTKKLFIQ